MNPCDLKNLMAWKSGDQILGILPFKINLKEFGKYSIKQIQSFDQITQQDKFQKIFWVLDQNTPYNYNMLRNLVNYNISDKGLILFVNLTEEKDIQSISEYIINGGFEDWLGPRYLMFKVRKYKQPYKKIDKNIQELNKLEQNNGK